MNATSPSRCDYDLDSLGRPQRQGGFCHHPARAHKVLKRCRTLRKGFFGGCPLGKGEPSRGFVGTPAHAEAAP